MSDRLLPGTKIRYRTNPARWSGRHDAPKPGAILTLKSVNSMVYKWYFEGYHERFMLFPNQDDFVVVARAEYPTEKPQPSKKGASPMFLKSFFTKTAGLVLFAAVAGSSASLVNSVSETPRLELGDWRKVSACDSCDHVSEGIPLALCPKCGGESFSTRKAQALVYDPWFGSQAIHGWEFADGSRSPVTGNFVIPERRTAK